MSGFATRGQGQVVYVKALAVTENIWGFPLDRKLCQRLTKHASLLKRSITEAKFRSFCSSLPKLHLHCKPQKVTSVQKWMWKQCCSFTFFCGDFSFHFPLSSPLLFTKSPVPWQAGQIKGICYHLVFFLNGYTCGTSGSKPDSLLTFLCSILCSHGNCCMFGRKLLKAVEKERESLGREHKGRATEGGREGGRASKLSVVGLHPV